MSSARPALALFAAACVPALTPYDHSKEALYLSERNGDPGFDSGDDGGGSGGGDGAVEPGALRGDLDISATNAAGLDCRAYFQLTGVAASTACPTCDWAYAMDFDYDASASVGGGDCDFTVVGMLGGPSGEQLLGSAWAYWGYTSDYYGSPAFLVGYGPAELYPFLGAVVTQEGNGFIWEFGPYEVGYYGYYYEYGVPHQVRWRGTGQRGE